MVGNHNVINKTHVRVVPDADMTTARQITLGARDVLHLTTMTHSTVAAIAANKAIQLTSCMKPGTFLATFLARLAGKLMVIANHMTQIKAPMIVKLNKANQSMKLITLRLIMGKLKHAQMTMGGMMIKSDCSFSDVRCVK